jgi:epoxyqueuosine reductase
MNIDILNSVIENRQTGFGIAELGFLHLTPALQSQISAKFANINLSEFPDYISKTTEERSNPLKLHPWAKSIIIAAIPFACIPDLPPFLQPASDPELSGKVAGYAMKKDYHKYGKELLAKFAEDLKIKSNCEFRTEIAIDTAPVAERTLATLAGLGRIGFNSCLLTKNNGSGCFIGEIFTDIEQFTSKEALIDNLPAENSCSSCEKCLKNCPTGAVKNGSSFKCKICRSYLTIEKRGSLSQKECKLVDDWIFGCDICTRSCPETNLPPPFEVDLQWLLLCPTAELKKAIKGTTLEYSGVTMLRRNALIVLKNRNTPAALNLITKFSEITGSEMLRNFVSGIDGG